MVDDGPVNERLAYDRSVERQRLALRRLSLRTYSRGGALTYLYAGGVQCFCLLRQRMLLATGITGLADKTATAIS
ncbi:MAG: hypothetical protein C5B44_00320 [Acidobacteria bacterium]|nr:MAG: hypothetical protein C5B44_00320 [Acidobacteriota bacterium]